MKKKTLYTAYGSNLNQEQMSRRCPTAELVGTGTLKDYALEFKGQRLGAFATITPQKGAEVPVAVWSIGAQDERNLDLYEGFPSHYFKERVDVEMEDGSSLSAMVYRMNLRMDYGLPSLNYLHIVSDGYEDCGLDKAALRTALEVSLKHPRLDQEDHDFYAAILTDLISDENSEEITHGNGQVMIT